MSTWIEAAPITGTLRESGTWDGPTATLVDGVFTCDVPAISTPSSIEKTFVIPLPTGIDLSDDTVIYRLKAEILEKTGGAPALLVAATACADPVGLVAETYSALDFLYPVGTVMTLATSVQQQKYTNNAPPAGNYTRQLVRVLSGADPAVKVDLSVLAFGAAANIPDSRYSFRLTLEKLEAAAGPPPAAVRYRDPADGQFKPLSQIGARGYPAGAPDYSAARINWAPAPEAFNVRPDPNIAPIAATTPLLPGATVTAIPGGLVWDVPAQNIASGAGTFGARAVFHIDPPVPVLTPSDDRSYRVVCDVLAEGTGGGPTTAIPQIALLAGATEPGVAYTYVSLKETMVNYPSTGRAFERLWSDFATVTPLAFYLTTPAVADWFANPLSLVVTMTASTVMGAVDVPAMRLTVTNVRLEALEVVAP